MRGHEIDGGRSDDTNMNVFNFRWLRLLLLVGGCLLIFAFCYDRGLGKKNRAKVTAIKRFVHQHTKALEEEIEKQIEKHTNQHYGKYDELPDGKPPRTRWNKAMHRLSNLWMAEDHPDSLKMDELTHCSAHIMHKLVELGLSIERRDIKDMRHMNRTHEVDCTSYHHSSDLRRQVHANVMEMPDVASTETITLITHLTSDRFDKLLDVMKHWTGPVSASVYVREAEDLETFSKLVCSSYIEQNWKEFYLHFVKEEGVFYPVNYLRNTALNRVQTDHVLILDVDFVPMPYLYETLHHYTQSGIPSPEEVLLVPAFEIIHEKKWSMDNFPQHKAELVHSWRDGRVQPFHVTSFVHSHKPTDYARWIQSTEPYQVEWKRWFEPYIVMKTDVVPKFHKHFVERGFDKSSHIMELHAMGFKFLVAPNCFILHTPHSLANTYSFKDMRLNRCSKEVYEHFLIHLGQKYKFFLSKEDLPKS